MTFAPQHETGGDPASAHARAWIVRLHAGEVTRRELQALAGWREANARHEEAWQAELTLWRALGPALEAEPAPEARHTAPPVSRRAFLGGAATACAVLAVGAGLTLRPREAGARVLETGTGETRSAALGQGIAVTLNTDSRLAFWPGDDNGGGAPRVTLERGEAIIRVAMAGAHSLETRAERCSVTARQAQFLLRIEDGRTRVACLAGEISVRANGRDMALTARKSVLLGAEATTRIAPVAADTETAWQRGLFVFENRPAGEVVAELNRYRPGYVHLPESKAATRISGVLSVNRADQAVDHVARMLGMKATRLPGGLVFLR